MMIGVESVKAFLASRRIESPRPSSKNAINLHADTDSEYKTLTSCLSQTEDLNLQNCEADANDEGDTLFGHKREV